jgi:hypothetical protein
MCRPGVPTTPSFHLHFQTSTNHLNAVWATFYMFQLLPHLLWEQAAESSGIVGIGLGNCQNMSARKLRLKQRLHSGLSPACILAMPPRPG